MCGHAQRMVVNSQSWEHVGQREEDTLTDDDWGGETGIMDKHSNHHNIIAVIPISATLMTLTAENSELVSEREKINSLPFNNLLWVHVSTCINCELWLQTNMCIYYSLVPVTPIFFNTLACIEKDWSDWGQGYIHYNITVWVNPIN